MSNEPKFPQVLDATILSSMRCPRKFNLAHVQRYSKEGGKSIHLIAGGAYAKGLEVARLAYMQGLPPEECLEKGVLALLEEYGDAECPETEAKTADRMVGALEYYFSQYPLEDDPARISVIAGVPAVEWRFALPLPFTNPDTGLPLLYAGRTDMICEFAGARYAEDDKTTKQLGASWANQWELRGQFMGYAWAGRELGLGLQGTLIRGVSILKTKYETAQAIVNTPDWKIDEWVEHRDYLIKRAIGEYVTKNDAVPGRVIGGYWEPAFDDTCNEYGGCMFKGVCGIPPERRINWLSTNYEENNWNPLDR
jgi:hypothetical protein